MSTPTEGMNGTLSLGGTAVALLSGIDLSWDREAVEWASMGESAVSDVLLGVKKHSGSFKKAFVSWTYYDIFSAGTALIGTIGPIGGTTTYMAGTFVIKGGSLSNMQQDSAAAVIEEGQFVMYNVSVAP